MILALWAVLILAASAQDNLLPDTSSGEDNETLLGKMIRFFADKLGTVTDSIVQLQITDDTNEIYILTKPDYRIYKVNREGTEKTLVKAIPSAKAFVLDKSNNIYYYGDNYVPYVLCVGSTKPVQFSFFAKVENPILVRPPADIEPSGAIFVVASKIYFLYPNGTADLLPLELKMRPTSSISVDAALQYFAVDNNIRVNYELVKIVEIIWTDLIEYILKILKKAMIYVSSIEVVSAIASCFLIIFLYYILF